MHTVARAHVSAVHQAVSAGDLHCNDVGSLCHSILYLSDCALQTALLWRMLNTKHWSCSAGFECLTEDLEEVMGLFNEVIQEPALQQDKIALYKAQVRGHCICCMLPCTSSMSLLSIA